MSGPSAVYILDTRGKVIICRDYRGEVPMNIIDKFKYHVIDEEDINIKPVFLVNGVTFCWILFNNVYFVGVTQRDANAMLIFSFLYNLANVLKDYFNEVEEESIRDNFSITYELLDEVADHGYPQTTESKILSEFIKNEAHQLTVSAVKPSAALTNVVSWRSEGIYYKKNEVFLDVIEKVDLLVAANGNVIRSEILGSLRMKSYLSGMPELKLGLNDKILLDALAKEKGSGTSGSSSGAGVIKSNRAVELEDVRFHQCVRLSKFESDRTISFIPPDGEFELMSYRQSSQIRPLILVQVELPPVKSQTKIDYVIKVKSQFKARSAANNVEIVIPVPQDATAPSFRAAVGNVNYTPDQDAFVWSLRQLHGQREISMTASFSLPSVASENRLDFKKHPILVKFEIPYFVVSGLTVRYLKIHEKSGYNALPWVRYITQNGDYQIRMT